MSPDRDEAPVDSEYVVHGDELKMIVRLARRRPLPFAYCPSKGEDDALFATHRKKPAELIARVTKRDSGQTRVAYGSYVVTGKVMVLTCTQGLPGIAKKLKKFMRRERLPLNVRVLDLSGNEIESDIEDLGDDDVLGPDDPSDDDAPARTGDPMLDRLAAVRGAVMAARGAAGDRLRETFAAAARAADNGSRDKVDQLVAMVEKDLRRVMNSSDRPRVAAARPARRAGDAPEPEDTPGPPAVTPRPDRAEEAAKRQEKAAEGPRPPDPDRLPQARRLNALHRRSQAAGDAAPRLIAALGIAARALRQSDTRTAAEAMDRIEAALDRIEARGTV